MAVAEQTTQQQVPRRSLAPARECVAPRPSTSVDHDELIFLDVATVLRSSGHGSVRDVHIFVEDGVVVLFGTLSSYHLKQVVQTDVMNLELVERVENHCEVEPVASQ